jgi:uncharacterized protein
MYIQSLPGIERAICVPEKTILVPVAGRVDVSGLLPIIDHPLFQLQLERHQVGFVYKVKPGGTHTRFEHSLGTLARVRDSIGRLGFTDPDLSRALEVLALLHDIGHGPFSHETEVVLGESHKTIGLRRIRMMADVIQQVTDFKLVFEFFTQRHPLSALVHDKNFGADKIDYLARDAYHTGYELGLNTSTIISYLQFDGQTLGVEEKAKEEIIRFQHAFFTMYLKVYLDKTAKQLARMYQRALTEHIMDTSDSKLAEAIWSMTDGEVTALLAKHPLMQRIVKRQLMNTVAVVKVAGFEQEERVAGRGYPVIELSEEDVASISAYLGDPFKVLAAEVELEQELDVPRGSLLLVQPNGYDSILPKDVPLFSLETGGFTSLFERVPSHPLSLRETRKRGFFIRVVVDPSLIERCRKYNFSQYFTGELLRASKGSD